jgi:hypothetical protein
MTSQLLATGPTNLFLHLGDRIRLSTGLELTLVYCEDMIPIFRAGEHAVAEMWTEHLDRPGLYLRVGDWPRGAGEVFDTDEVIKRALTAQNIAENFFRLDDWVPLAIRRGLSPGEMA